MSRHPIVCIDLDHTLLDSETSESLSFDHTLRAVGVEDPSVHLGSFLAINGEMWAAVERGEMAAADVRLARFTRFVDAEGLAADPALLADTYAGGLATNGELFPGARPVLDELAGMARLALVTNGVSDIQRARIDRLGIAEFFEAIVISSEIGASKPAAAFFEETFDRLGSPSREDVLMVGDSLTSDMQGGVDFGIATCWVDRNGGVTDLAITYRIEQLEELPPIVRGV
jgi:2-haloacid dehalogenase